MKDKTLEELIALLEDVAVELHSRRYFEYLENIGKWVMEIPDPRWPERFPSAGMSVPIEGMDEILAAIDKQRERLKEHPQLAAYQNITVSAEELKKMEQLAEKLWDEAITSPKEI